MTESSHIEALNQRTHAQASEVRADTPSGTNSAGSRRPRLIQGRYRLLSEIGSGRLGPIYAARDETVLEYELERRVAVQVLDAGLVSDDGLMRRLRHGYAVLRERPHPNVVEILDFGRDDRIWFVVTELLEGVSFRFVLNDAGWLPEHEAAPVLRRVGDGLRFLHAKGIVHGRIMPESVFVTLDQDLKLLDVAPGWMPTVAGEPSGAALTAELDIRDDVFGLACFAYELLSGRHPFNSCSALEARRARLVPEPIDSLSDDQWHALARGLALDAEQRTHSVAALLGDLGLSDAVRTEAAAPRPAARERSARGEPADAAAHPKGVPAAEATRAVFASRPLQSSRTPRRRVTGRRLLTGLAAIGIAVALAWQFYPPLRSTVSRLLPGATAFVDGASPPAGLDEPASSADGAAAASGEAELGRAIGSSETEDAASSPARPGTQAAAVAGERSGSGSASGGGGEPQAAPAEADRGPGLESAPGASSAVASAGSSSLSSEHSARTDEPPASTAETPAARGATELGGRAGPGAASARAGDEQRGEPAGDVLPTSVPGSGFEIVETSITASEGSGFVEVVVRRTGAATEAASVVWWTSEDTALGDEDYAELGPSIEEFAADEMTRSLYVPLVDDSRAEARERFFVYIGQRNPDTGTLSPLGNARVEITDDD